MEHSSLDEPIPLRPQTLSQNDEMEDLPFAVAEAGSERLSAALASQNSTQKRETPSSSITSETSVATRPELPGLVSSVISSSTNTDSSLLATDSDYLDAAASLLPLNTSLHVHKSWSNLEQSQQDVSPAVAETTSLSTSEGGFLSVLLSQADDRTPPATTTASPARLPVLHEESSVQHSIDSGSLIVEEGPEEGPRIHRYHRFRHPHSPKHCSLASLAGATSTTTGPNEFTVSVPLQSSVLDVMEILGNPDLLTLWYDAVPSLIIVRSSEGARNAIDRDVLCERLYEGEWIEASVPSGCVLPSGCRAFGVQSLWGCPVFGKLSMFVERPTSQVSLTVGPFPGNLEIVHKIQVVQVDSSSDNSGKVQIQDTVKIRSINDGSNDEDCCHCLDVLQRCFLPSTDAYRDQVLSSMARLRFLIENGEKHQPTASYLPPTLPSYETEASSPLLVQA